MTEPAKGHYQLNGTAERKSDDLFRVFSQWGTVTTSSRSTRRAARNASSIFPASPCASVSGATPCSEFTQALVDQWATKRVKTGVTANSVNREIDVLKSVPQAAVRAKKLTASLLRHAPAAHEARQAARPQRARGVDRPSRRSRILSIARW